MTYRELLEYSNFTKEIIPDEESFNDILNTFYEEELKDLESDNHCTKNMRVLHILARATDLITKRSFYTEDDVLRLTGESSALELPVESGLKQWFILKDIKTIDKVLDGVKDTYIAGEVLDALEKLSLDEKTDLQLSAGTEWGDVYVKYADILPRQYSFTKLLNGDASELPDGFQEDRRQWVVKNAL